MKKPHAGFWLATLGLGVCWLLALLTRDRLNGILLAGAALALILPRRPPQRRGPGCLGWHRHGWALELQRRAALQRATRPAALGHRALDRLRLLVVLAAGRGQSGPWPLAVLGAAVGPSPTPCPGSWTPCCPTCHRSSCCCCWRSAGRFICPPSAGCSGNNGTAERRAAAGKIMPQAIAYRLPDRVY